MTNKSNLADNIAALAELYPQTFSLYQAKRRPLKAGIHSDLLATGAITPKECAAALRVYCNNFAYLRQCTQVGTARIDLAGNTVGHVTIEEAKHARERLNQQSAKCRGRQEAEAKAKAAAEAKIHNAGRISMSDLRAMAKARREAAAA
jgi:ProP effector